MYETKILKPEDFELFKQLTIWYQEDDNETVVVPTDEYLMKLLSKPDFHVIVALDGNIVIGGVTAYELMMYKESVTDMFLYEMGVRAEYRRKGVASSCIYKLIQLCKDLKINELFVDAEADNEAGNKLYSATGGVAKDVIEYTYKI